MKYFVTGVAGFIGFHVARRLLVEGHSVVGFDNLSHYYDPTLKEARLNQLRDESEFYFILGDVTRPEDFLDEVAAYGPDIIVHLAAQAGVRYSLDEPREYLHSNVVGTFNILELARIVKPRHLLIASSSSIYGGNDIQPYSEFHRTDFPMSFYAATKKAAEDLSHSYSHLHSIPTTCFRFFTVYGPWGRPDMALFKFVKKMLDGDFIEIYGNGEMKRDFTYIDDLVEGILRLSHRIPSESGPDTGRELDSHSRVAPWRTVNISGGRPIGLMDFVATLENVMGIEAKKRFLPRPDGDVLETFADHKLLERLTGFRPGTTLAEGVAKFVDWYEDYLSKDLEVVTPRANQ